MTRLGRRVQVIDGCWIVDGRADRYLRVRTPWGDTTAHRYVWEQVNGEHLDASTHVHHTCHTPGCIRPDHLEAMSVTDHARLHAELRAS